MTTKEIIARGMLFKVVVATNEIGKSLLEQGGLQK